MVFKFEFSMMPRLTFALLNTKGGWGSFFLLKVPYWACLVGPGLKFFFKHFLKTLKFIPSYTGLF